MFSPRLFRGSILAAGFFILPISATLAQTSPGSPPSAQGGIAEATSRIGGWQDYGEMYSVIAIGSYDYDTNMVTSDFQSYGNVVKDPNALAYTATSAGNQDSDFSTSVYSFLQNSSNNLEWSNTVHLNVYVYGDVSRINPSGTVGTFSSAYSFAKMGNAYVSDVKQGTADSGDFYQKTDTLDPSEDADFGIFSLNPHTSVVWTGSISGHATTY